MNNFSPELFSSLVERIDLGIIVLDSNLCIRRWNGFISLELFNPEYDQLPVELVIRTGLEKTRELLNAK